MVVEKAAKGIIGFVFLIMAVMVLATLVFFGYIGFEIVNEGGIKEALISLGTNTKDIFTEIANH
jgi:hypothetical protein